MCVAVMSNGHHNIVFQAEDINADVVHLFKFQNFDKLELGMLCLLHSAPLETVYSYALYLNSLPLDVDALMRTI